MKERRKVRLVELPDHKMSGRGVPVARAVPPSQSRPMSADDIQKAKMRAMYMQDKYGKAEKTGEPRAAASSSRAPANGVVPPHMRTISEVIKGPTKFNKIETPINPQRNSTSQEHSLEKLKKDQLQWQSIPEVRMSPSWRVGAGENSKQVRVQTQRNGREEEAFYSNPRVIPPNPKEPWDVETDFDDSLTTEIPLVRTADLEPPAARPSTAALAPASDDADTGPPPSSPCDNSRAAAAEDSTASTSAATAAPSPSSAATGSGLPEPDIELLAALLKNPEIVHTLTSGRGKNLTDNQKVALLDLVKKNGVGLAGIANGLASVTEVPMSVPVFVPVSEPEPVSLPSPTPPASATRVGWRSEFPSHAQSTQLQPPSSITTGPKLASHALPPPPPPPPPPPLPPPPTIYMDATHPTANQMAFNHHQAQQQQQQQQQCTVPANPWPPQQHRLPAPNLQPTMMTATTTAFSYGHALSWQAPNPPEIILPPDHYQSSMPPFPPPTMKPQPRALPETASYLPEAPAWTPSAGAAFWGGQNLVPVSRTGYPNDFINGPVYPANGNNNNNYNSNNMYPQREAWVAPGRQPSDVRYDRNPPEPRREYGRSPQAEWSRQGYSRHNIEKRWWNRDQDGNRRW